MAKEKKDIQDRFLQRNQAERYRNRFKKGFRKWTNEREVSALDKLLTELGNLDVVIDVACGPGRFVHVLSSHANVLLQTDYSDHMLNISKEDFPIGEKKTGYFSADARKIPLKSDSVDLVFCHRYLNHIDNSDERRMIMSELARVSRRYVVVSCLGAPSFIRFIRHHWYLLTGITTQDESIAVSQLVESAIQAGLKLQTKTPISPMISSAVFLTFTK